jgi:hypothetical protein
VRFDDADDDVGDAVKLKHRGEVDLDPAELARAEMRRVQRDLKTTGRSAEHTRRYAVQRRFPSLSTREGGDVGRGGVNDEESSEVRRGR